MRLAELRGRRVALLGLGSDVGACVPAVIEADPSELLVVEERGVGSSGLPDDAVRTLADAAARAEVFVRSPGFPRYLPEVQAALAGGAAMTTPIDLWLGSCAGDSTVVAITGTKGKSTVTDMVGVLARDAGLEVGVAGNLGVPVFSDDWAHDAPLIVLEVSSYQAADLHHVPEVAVVTFLSEDHLSWHGGVERYVDDKLRMVANEGGVAPTVLVGEVGGSAAVELERRGVAFEVVGAPTATSTDVPRHRLQNAALAAAALAAAGGPPVDPAVVLEAARSSLPGRLDELAGPPGMQVRWVDDALASNPSATAAGLAWLRGLALPTVVILGGADRGVDPRPLIDEVARWGSGALRAVALPDNGRRLALACGIDAVADAIDAADAVGAARSLLGDVPAGVVIFSPASPTRPGEGNWQTRSDQFRAAVAALSPATP